MLFRSAEADTLEVLREKAPRDFVFHVHSFTGTLEFAQTVLEEWPNCMIGFTGIITFKNAADLRRVVEAVPIERMLSETDGPFLAPVPYRGKTAHSGYIPVIIQKIAEIKGLPVETVAATLRENARRFYGF